MGAITDDAIRRAVTRGAFDAGLMYQMDGRVEEVRAGPDGSLIEARVRGRSRAPYRQVIRVTQARDGRLSISGACTCPVGFNCKHVAAALFACQEQAGFAATPATARPAFPGILPRSERSAPTAPSIDAPLPPDVDAWLRSVEAAQEVETEDYPPTIRKRMLYVLERGGASGAVVVDLRSIELRKDGSAGGASKRYTPQQISSPGQQPRFLRPSDRAILQRLATYGQKGTEEFVGMLRAIIATGRGRWGAWDGPALTEGEPVAGTLAWTLSDDGRQRPELKLPGHLVPLHLAVPWYVDPAAGVLGPVETELPAKLVRAVLASPWLAPATAARVRGELSRRWPDRRSSEHRRPGRSCRRAHAQSRIRPNSQNFCAEVLGLGSRVWRGGIGSAWLGRGLHSRSASARQRHDGLRGQALHRRLADRVDRVRRRRRTAVACLAHGTARIGERGLHVGRRRVWLRVRSAGG